MIGSLVSVADRYKRARYFEETFLVADLSRDLFLGMLFVLADFSWKKYTTANALVATKQAEIVDKNIQPRPTRSQAEYDMWSMPQRFKPQRVCLRTGNPD